MPCRLKILYVEDDPEDVALFKHVLRRVRPTLRTVSNGGEAIQYLKGMGIYRDRVTYPKPDLIFLDWHMPIMGGREFLSWFRKTPHFQSTPVVALLGAAFDHEAEQAKALGAHLAVIKPNSVQTLSVCVLEILSAAVSRRFPRD